VASVEEQLKKEMTVYEVWLKRKKYWINIYLHFVCALFSTIGMVYAPQKFIIGMLTNFGSMSLDRIHNTLKVRPKHGQESLYPIYWPFFYLLHILISFYFFLFFRCSVLPSHHMTSHCSSCKVFFLV
jgi:hypothetical protein